VSNPFKHPFFRHAVFCGKKPVIILSKQEHRPQDWKQVSRQQRRIRKDTFSAGLS
jgi:hypothetical protein